MLDGKILKEYNTNPKTYIIESETETDNMIKLLYCEIDGYRYCFNVDWVPEDELDWLAEFYSGSLNELKNRTEEKIRKEIGDKFNDFLSAIGKK